LILAAPGPWTAGSAETHVHASYLAIHGLSGRSVERRSNDSEALTANKGSVTSRLGGADRASPIRTEHEPIQSRPLDLSATESQRRVLTDLRARETPAAQLQATTCTAASPAFPSETSACDVRLTANPRARAPIRNGVLAVILSGAKALAK
jgi:hypothetical protein